MANVEMKEIVNENVVTAVEEAVAEKGIRNVTGKRVALGTVVVASVVGLVKLAVFGVKKYQENHELKLAERGDLDKSENETTSEEEAE